ncbi:MAG: hypothetical protein PHE52_01520 [Candidatus Pacebacteria bacterium]|nr:hypothetical protein [Candidatus Paceibacterota bacterium]
MGKLFKIFSQNKKTLLLILAIGLFLVFLPSFKLALADCTSNCTECSDQTACETSDASCFWNASSSPPCASAGCVTAGEEQITEWCPGCGWNPASWLTCFSCVVQSIFSLPVRLAFFLLAVIIGLFGLLSGFLFSVVISLMNWMKDIFLQIPITPANQSMGSDFVVRVGWEFSRDVVNMLFILILVFIGLATILKLREYEAKKTLPLLIIIALLINFSGVIVGFVVDLGNILTKFFFDQAGEQVGLGAIWSNSSTYLIDSMKAVFSLDGQFFQNFGQTIGSFLGIVAYGLILILFYGVATMIYFVILLIFFFRVLVLWILTILAPLAFASYILPNTRRWWSEWWQQLIQWSIIGIPIGFFLWISNWVMRNTSALEGAELFNKSALQSGLSCQFAVLIGSILAPTIAIVMLGVGAMLSMRMAPSSAQGLINFGKRAGMGAMKLGAMAAGTALGRKVAPVSEKWGERLRQWGQKPLEAQGFLGKAGKYTGLAQLARFGARQTGKGLEVGGREVLSRIAGRDEAQIAEAEKKAANRNSADNINDAIKAKAMGNMNSYLGYIKGTIKNGDTDDIVKAVDSGKLDWKDIAKAYKVSEARGTPHRRLLEKAFLGRMDELGVSEANQEKIWDKIKTEDLAGDVIAAENLDPKTEMGRNIIDKIMTKGDSQLTSQMLRLKKKQREAIWEHIQGKGAQWFVDNNREDILRWSTSTAAKGLGLGAIGGVNPIQIDNMVIERDLLGKSEDELKTRLGNLKNELPTATKGNKGKILAETRRIENELALRSKGTDELLAEKIPYAAFIEQFEKMDPGKREVKDYEMNAQNREGLARINRELKRRGIETAEFTPPIKPEDQPLAVQIAALQEREKGIKDKMPTLYHQARSRAQAELKGVVKQRQALEKQFKALPEDIQVVERFIRGTEGGIQEFDNTISSGESRVAQLKQIEKEGEKWLEEAKRTGATKEALETREKRNAAVRKEREGLEAKIRIVEVKRDEQKNLADKYRGVWKNMMAGEKVQPIEVIIRDELTNVIKMEKGAQAEWGKAMSSRESKKVIDTAREKLNSVREKRNFLEGELASQLRMKDLGGKLKDLGSRTAERENLMTQFKTTSRDLDAEIDATNKEIESINKGLAYQKERLDSVREQRADLSAQIQTEILQTHPEWKTVPPKTIREREKIDPRFRPLDEEIKTAQKTAGTLERNMESKEKLVKDLRTKMNEATGKYNDLTREGRALQSEIEKIEEEIGEIERRKITPKLPKSERNKLEKSS